MPDGDGAARSQAGDVAEQFLDLLGRAVPARMMMRSFRRPAMYSSSRWKNPRSPVSSHPFTNERRVASGSLK